MKKYYSILFVLCTVLALAFLLSACKESYTKVQKSTDVNYKLGKAIEYYHKKRYYQAIPIFEELIGLLKADKRAEDVYYYYSDAEYQEKNYVLAAYHFKRFVEIYPESKWAEEALFKYAESFSKQSPTVDLEQENTARGIDAYQYFINSFPNSTRVPECNKIIEGLHKKLEQKSLSIADLYYKTENYRAASLSFKQTMRDFPDIGEAERLSYMIVKSDYKFAQLSINSKKAERYKDVIKDYKAFIERYPATKYKNEVEKYVEDSRYEIVRSLLYDAEAAHPEDKEILFNEVARAYMQFGEDIKNDKIKLAAKDMMIESQYLIVKNRYNMAVADTITEQKQGFQNMIVSYQKFIDKFADSKYKKPAEKLYRSTINILQKLNH